MLSKPTAAPPRISPLVIIIAMLGLFILSGLAVLYFLDRSMIAQAVNKRDASGHGAAATNRANNTGTVAIVELTPKNLNSLGKALDANALMSGDINPSQARQALRSASGKTIQSAVQAKTGKSVSLNRIEKVRSKALSAEGQRKINEALKRRDEVDIGKIRDKLNF